MRRGGRPRWRVWAGALATGLLPGLYRRLARSSPGGGGAAVAAALARSVGAVEPILIGTERHPLTPAALRVERTRSRGRRRRADQVAVTMWFGEGPALPSPGGAPRAALRLGAGLVGAAAAAVAAAAVAQMATERQPQRLAPVEEPPRLSPPAA